MMFSQEATPWLQEVIKWRLYPMHGFFCVCSFIVGKRVLDLSMGFADDMY